MKPSKTELKHNIKNAMIREHGEGLIKFFKLDPNLVDPIDLCKKLRKLENKAHEITTQLCNGYPDESPKQAEFLTLKLEEELINIEDKVKALLGSAQLKADNEWENQFSKINGIFINGDPRGYALKLGDDTVKHFRELGLEFPHKDWGGYGILAPDLTSDIENEVNWISENWDELNGDMLPTKHEYECRGFLKAPQIILKRG